MSDATSLRGRLLSGLLAEPGATLRAHDGSISRLVTGGEELVLIDDGPDLAARLAQIVRGHERGLLHVVAVGAGKPANRTLDAAAPFWQINRRLAFSRLEPNGDLVHVTGPRSDALNLGVLRMPTAPVLGEAEIAARVGQGGGHHADVARLATALGRRVPWVTVTIAVICVALFVLGQLWAGGSYGSILVGMGANVGALVERGEVWRVLASAFLHRDIMHLIVNMIALISFGTILEKLLGARRYIVLYGLSALGGGLASAFLRGPGSSVGASGAIWGLMTAGVGLALRPRGLLPPLALQQAKRAALVPLAINTLYSFRPGIDLYAHFGGGAVGFALWMSGLITAGVQPAWTEAGPRGETARREPPILTAAAALIAAALLGSVGFALAKGQPWTFGRTLTYQRVNVGDTGVSVEIPSILADDLTVKDDNFIYGNLGKTPVVVGVIVTAFPSDPPTLEMQLMAAQIGEPSATAQTAYGRQWVTFSKKLKNDVTLRTWTTITGGKRIELVTASRPDRPAAWSGIEDRLLSSLTTRAAPRRRRRRRSRPRSP